MSRIGIMGGTFDPIHSGHINIAAKAKTEYHLDKVIFLTSGNPPHKRAKQVMDAGIRHIMVRRAVFGYMCFSASDYEVKKGTYSYTYETLLHFKERFPEDELFFIIGGDSLRDFKSWYKPEEILKLCTLLVYDRAGGEIDSRFAKIIHGDKIPISSTGLRRMVMRGEDISMYVPDSVNRFIEKNRLYRGISDPEAELRSMLTPERFAHSIGVRDMAVKMAEIFGVSPEKAYIAGMLHDNAKNLDGAYTRCRDLEVELDEFELKSPPLVHAKLGAETAKCVFGITDPEIIDAIRWHTIGRPYMTTLEKIIFVADLTEPGRSFSDIEGLRHLALTDLDRAVFECIRGTMKINKMRGAPIHPNAERVINSLKI